MIEVFALGENKNFKKKKVTLFKEYRESSHFEVQNNSEGHTTALKAVYSYRTSSLRIQLDRLDFSMKHYEIG